MKKPILIVGGLGKTGARVARRLEVLGIPATAVSRSTSPSFDWTDRSTWLPALAGHEAAYTTYYPDLLVPSSVDDIGAFAKMAVENGVRRLVLLSGRGEPQAQLAEDALKASGADWTILRCAWFSQNFSESLLLGPLLAGVVALPVGGVREPFVDADDIADAAVAALTQSGHTGQLYELTGPRLLTFAEAVGEIAAASGRPIRYEQIAPGEFSAMLAADGLPEDIVALVMQLFTEVLDGRNESLTDGVFRALGRPAKDLSSFAREAAATGIWTPAPRSRAIGGAS